MLKSISRNRKRYSVKMQREYQSLHVHNLFNRYEKSGDHDVLINVAQF